MTIDRWYAHDRDRRWTSAPPRSDALAFHRSLDDYAPTPLVDAPGLATRLGVGRVLIKDESSRLGLPAFKALGASWAVREVVNARAGSAGTLVTATDGNHGRAVARYARLLGQHAQVYVPHGVSEKAIAAIEAEGAPVTRVDGTYDEAVAAARAHAEAFGHDIVQDTAWPGYEQVPGWIVDGYRTLLVEIDEGVRDRGLGGIDVVIVPTGVGSLLQAVLAHYRADTAGPAVVSVEPDAAAFLAPSLVAGAPATVDTDVTVMAGLNCGTAPALAWPYIHKGLDAAVTVSDEMAMDAAALLADAGVDAGPCGAASLAAATVIADEADRMRHLGLGPDSTVVLLMTEGAASS